MFYGGDIREAELPWLRRQIEELAALPPADEDGDLPTGFFLVTDERGGASTWQIRDGSVEDGPAASLAWLGR